MNAENKTRAQPNWVIMKADDSNGSVIVVKDQLSSKAEAEGLARQLCMDELDTSYSVYRYGGTFHAQRQTKVKVFCT